MFAQSVYNLIGINHIMNDVAKIDNLPDKHTIEALLLLRHAWSNVDAYTYYADHYKKIAKFCYFMMLLLGIMIVSMGVMLFNSDNVMGINRTNANLITLGLSLSSAIVAGYTSFMNPAARWHHLRSSALTCWNPKSGNFGREPENFVKMIWMRGWLKRRLKLPLKTLKTAC